MKNLRLRALHACLVRGIFALGALAISASSARAQVLISDTFTRAGNLNGTTPTTELGSATWVANSYYTTNGTSLQLVDTTSSENGVTAYIAIPSQYINSATGSLLTGYNYQLTLDVTIVSTNNSGTAGIGFGNFSNTGPPINPPNTLGAAIIDDSNSTNLVEAYYLKPAITSGRVRD